MTESRINRYRFFKTRDANAHANDPYSRASYYCYRCNKPGACIIVYHWDIRLADVKTYSCGDPKCDRYACDSLNAINAFDIKYVIVLNKMMERARPAAGYQTRITEMDWAVGEN